MDDKIIMFGDIEIEKQNFNCIKILFFWKMTILITYQYLTRKNINMFLYDNYRIKPLHTMHPKRSGYLKVKMRKLIAYMFLLKMMTG